VGATNEERVWLMPPRAVGAGSPGNRPPRLAWLVGGAGTGRGGGPTAACLGKPRSLCLLRRATGTAACGRRPPCRFSQVTVLPRRVQLERRLAQFNNKHHQLRARGFDRR